MRCHEGSRAHGWIRKRCTKANGILASRGEPLSFQHVPDLLRSERVSPDRKKQVETSRNKLNKLNSSKNSDLQLAFHFVAVVSLIMTRFGKNV
jgi:hypothetical protein